MLKMDTGIINLPAFIDQPHLPSTLRAALDSAMDLASNSHAASTRAAYAADFRIFSAWCADQGLCPMPANPATVAAFLADQVKAGMKPSTLGRRLAAIKYPTRSLARILRPMTPRLKPSCKARKAISAAIRKQEEPMTKRKPPKRRSEEL
jgi:hypothetical protein